MRILALDLGTKTGWALSQYTAGVRHITSGVQSFSPGRFEGGGMRFLRLGAWLEEVNKLCGGVQAIYFEEVRRHASTDAAHAYGGYMGKLTEWCELNHVPYQGVPVGTIKKHATGKGNASKEEMMAKAKARGHTPKDDNEADALAILYWAFDHAPTSTPDIRPASDQQPAGRIPLGSLRLARRPMRS